MGEQIRRLDYERRSKFKSLMKSTTGIQNIKKECSTQVRAANEMEDRKKNLYFLRNELHKRNFLERHEYEVKVVERFHEDLDLKSQNFSEKKFQLLRAQSAGPRVQKENPVVLAMVPKKYYEQLSDESDEEDWGTRFKADKRVPARYDKSEQKGISKTEDAGNKLLNFCTLRAVLSFKSKKKKKEKPLKRIPSFSADTNKDRVSESLRFLHPSEFRRLQRAGASDQIGPRSDNPPERSNTAPPGVGRITSANYRRQSTLATNVAYIPREVKSAPPRRNTGLTNGVGEGNSGGEASRSYRLLKEAFKKTKKEVPSPSKDRFVKIKSDHEKRVKLLNQRIKRRFNDIFEETIFQRPLIL